MWMKFSLSNRKKGTVTLDIVARYITTGFSFINILFLVKLQNLNDFSAFQVAYSLASIVTWISDIGLGITLIQALASNKMQLVKSIWSLRIAIFLLISAFSYGFAFYAVSPNFIFFFAAANFDLFTDSNLNLRVVSTRRTLDYTVQPLKKFVQFASLILLYISSTTVDSRMICTVYVLPSLALLIFDTRRFGGFTIRWELNQINKSASKWLQSGGLALVNLDNLILGYFGMHSIIVILAITKKIYSAIAVVATAAVPKVLFQVTKDKIIGRHIRILIAKVTLSTGILAVLASIFHSHIFQILLKNIPLYSAEHFMITVYLLTLPLTIMCLALNATLLGLNRNFSAAAATYSSSVIYLSVLYISLCYVNGGLAVSIASVTYVILWLLIQLTFLRKELFRKSYEFGQKGS